MALFLPQEILFMIFEYLEGDSSIASIILVCKTWSCVADDEELYKGMFRRRMQSSEFTKMMLSRSLGIGNWRMLYISKVLKAADKGGVVRCINCNNIYWRRKCFSNACDRCRKSNVQGLDVLNVTQLVPLLLQQK